MSYKEVEQTVIISCQRRQLSKARMAWYKQTLRVIEKLDIDFDNLAPSEIDRFFFYISNCPEWKQWTKLTHWKCFKKIVRILQGNSFDFSPWIMKTPQDQPDILTLSEINLLIGTCDNFRDRLIILLLYESGARIEEFRGITRKNISFDGPGARIRLEGKTGTRYVRIMESAPWLKMYLEVTLGDKIFTISESRICHILRECAKKCGLKKRVYPHLLRHTRATHLATHLTESELKVFFGWAQSSRMPGIYVHLSSGDIDEKIIGLSTLKPAFLWPTSQELILNPVLNPSVRLNSISPGR